MKYIIAIAAILITVMTRDYPLYNQCDAKWAK